METKPPLVRKTDEIWELPASYKQGMRVPGRLFLSKPLLDALERETLEQVANVATLPGIQAYSMAMPDAHLGYGFPIGGVAAFAEEDGVISPGGVGFDINCGVRLLTSDIVANELGGKVPGLVDQLFADVPSGVGSKSEKFRARGDTMDQVFVRGARWAVEQGFGMKDDVEHCEEGGAFAAADPRKVGPKPRERGASQLGTLGSGNHFLEVQEVVELYDEPAAKAFGLHVGQACFAIHCGSRGAGHQICTDYLQTMERAARKYGITMPDRQLACAPIRSQEGQDYFAAMAAGANYAWANRQMITHWVRQAFAKVLRRDAEKLGMDIIYDVAHNIAKIERHHLDGKEMTLCIHRKGATRAFPPGHPDVPAKYQAVGQPVMVPGDMGRYSFICVGTERAMAETWGSTCHGAGRLMSRHAAKRELQGVDIAARLADKGILVRTQNKAALAEEASEAYKDVAEVVDVLHDAGIALRVARLRPIGVVKG